MLIITSHDKVITNYVRFAYYKLRQSVVTNNHCFFYYKLRQSSYKLRQVLQITTKLLQIATTITNYGNYYNLRQNNR